MSLEMPNLQWILLEYASESGLPCLVGAGDLICWAYADGGVFRNSTEPIVTTADNPAFDLVVAVRVVEGSSSMSVGFRDRQTRLYIDGADFECRGSDVELYKRRKAMINRDA